MPLAIVRLSWFSLVSLCILALTEVAICRDTIASTDAPVSRNSACKAELTFEAASESVCAVHVKPDTVTGNWNRGEESV